MLSEMGQTQNEEHDIHSHIWSLHEKPKTRGVFVNWKIDERAGKRGCEAHVVRIPDTHGLKMLPQSPLL